MQVHRYLVHAIRENKADVVEYLLSVDADADAAEHVSRELQGAVSYCSDKQSGCLHHVRADHMQNLQLGAF